MNSEEDSSSQPKVSGELKKLLQDALEEFHSVQAQRTEPAHKAELQEERRRRELLERKLNELVEENRRTRARAESIERETQIKNEFQRRGVTKLDLAFKAVKDEVQREPDGSLTARGAEGAVPLPEFVKKFLDENPELLPARNLGGSGTAPAGRNQRSLPSIDIDSIRPGMSKEDLARVREHIARVALGEIEK
jgi:hypothetical protein